MSASTKWQFLAFWKSYIVILTPLLLLPIPLVCKTAEARCGYIVCIMAIYWMTEALPLPVTALIPLVGFPFLGVMSTGDLCSVYMKETVMLFIGGLTVATSVEHCNLHRRIAISVLLKVGQSPQLLMLGFMITTMFLSMWISNTASTAMMVPIVEAILVELYSKDSNVDDDKMPPSEIQTPKPSITLILSSENGVQKTFNARDEPNSNTTEANSHVLLKTGASMSERALKESATDSGNSKQEKNLNPADNSNLTEIGVQMKKALMLSVAYSANIGGTGVVTGTGPNLVFMATLNDAFEEPTGVTFASWMAFNVPGMLICVCVAYFWLQFYYMGSKGVLSSTTKEQRQRVKTILQSKYDALGTVTFHESVVLTLFVCLVTMWFFRSPEFIPGWASWFFESYGPIEVEDSTPVMLVIILLFIIPKEPYFFCLRDPNDTSPVRSSEGCLTWDVVQRKVPWGIVLLLGGGFAMAEAANYSGLSNWLGEQLTALDVMPVGVIVLIVSAMTALATEVASNSATASILMPVLLQMSLSINVNPIYLMLPSVVSCSFAFMLPVASPPNAIVYSASGMKTSEMMKAGIVMNILCIIVINITINTLGILMFDVRHFPDWANTTVSSY